MDHHHSVLLFLDGPADRLEFSLDGVFGRIGAKFEGFFQVPNGVHFISYRMVSGGDKDVSGEGPFFTLILDLMVPSVLLFNWNPKEETFLLSSQSFSADFRDEKLFEYPGLMTYSRFMQKDSVEAWKCLISIVSGTDLDRVFYELKITNDDSSSVVVYEVTSMHESHHSLLQNLKVDQGTTQRPRICFIQIPTLKDFSVQNPILTTTCAMDKTAIFNSLNISIADLLTEMQISFLLLSFAQNFEGFEQWMDCVDLLCRSGSLMQNNLKECKRFLNLIQNHLEMCPDDFFSGLMNENRLYLLLNGLFCDCDPSIDPFKGFFEKKFGWIFSGKESPEDAPVIVEL